MKRIIAALGFLLAGTCWALCQTSGLEFKYPLAVTAPRLYSSVTRIWQSKCDTITFAYWSAVETARGVYDWSCLDSQVSKFAQTNLPIIYTFGSVPGWANGNQASGVPPTDYQDLYDYATAVATRYRGRIAYYEIWNEFHGASYWTGTTAQMFTLAQGEVAAIRAADPAAQILCPSASQYPETQLYDYYAMGGGSVCGIVNEHNYYYLGSNEPNPYAPEQSFMQIGQLNAFWTEFGQTAKPFWIDEGGAFSATTSTTAARMAWAAIWQLSQSSMGVDKWVWFQYDVPTGQGSVLPLNDDTQILKLSPAGTAYRSVNSWLAGKTWSTPLARVHGTNQVTNPTGTGFVAGTPGTAPTDWIILAPDTADGIFTSILGSCSSGGHTGISFRIFGTLNDTGSNFVQLTFASNITVNFGEAWAISMYVQRTAGSNAGISNAHFRLQSDGSRRPVNMNMITTSAPLDQNLYEYWGTVPIGGHVMTPRLLFSLTRQTAIDATFCIADIAEDNSTVWTGVLSGASGYQGLVAWDANGAATPSTFAVPNTYPYLRDLYGQPGPVAAGGNYTLSNLPVLFENQPFKGWLQ